MIKQEIEGLNRPVLIGHSEDPSFIISMDKQTPVVRITPDGKIFWHEREVTTDQQFRDCIMTMMALMSGRPSP